MRIMTADLSNAENLNEIADKIGLVKILREYGLLDDEYNSQYIGGYNFIDFNLINSLEIFWEFKTLDSKGWYLHFNHIKYYNFKLSISKIYNFIQEKLNSKIQKESQIPPFDEVEPIAIPEDIKTTKTDVIRLLHYTGILDFLLKKYPRMNESNLASFFELITKTPITHKNQNKQFYKNTDDSMYHKDNLDLILSKFNMIAENSKK